LENGVERQEKIFIMKLPVEEKLQMGSIETLLLNEYCKCLTYLLRQNSKWGVSKQKKLITNILFDIQS